MTTQPHILLTTDAVGGVWSYTASLAASLAERGARVTVATLGPRPGARQADAMPAPLLHTDLPLDWTAPDRAALDAASAALAELAGTIAADSVHLHAPALAAAAAWPCGVVAVAHSCVATWWAAVRGGDMPADLAWRARATAAGMRAADATLAPSAAFARMLARAYPDAPGAEVVPNGAAPRARAPTRRSRQAFTAGRLWDDAKNARVLDAAAGKLDAPLRAAGPLAGPGGEAFRPRHLACLGPLHPDAIAAELAAAGAFVSAARYEPFGLAVLEAAQAGVPLVLADIPTFRELWDGAAAFVPADDATGFAAALRRILDDAARAAALGEAARRRGAAYGIAAMAERVLAVHRRVSRRPRSRAA